MAREQYEYDLKKAREYNAEMKYARKPARKEAREFERIATAKKLHNAGMDADFIMENYRP